MPHCQREPAAAFFIVIGCILGALSWFGAAVCSGTFEPYDSSMGLLVNQAVLTLPAVCLAWRFRATAPALLLLGSYVGMNIYSYAFGGSEARGWFLLGAIMSLFLVAGPALFALGTVLLRYLSRRQT